jgi:hypothetical protein
MSNLGPISTPIFECLRGRFDTEFDTLRHEDLVDLSNSRCLGSVQDRVGQGHHRGTSKDSSRAVDLKCFIEADLQFGWDESAR